ncbi:uncharacterized protein K452DRAFT_271087 [Aplosporella prunicola CBS 121167]|uniref:Phenolic acid decarboxylase n=1 Tax=Aplosporella prunicola CBS 121167 TaxID=1176127 RepID=A0A6A6BDJ4_9PEZI|nr:uncharacterized protein K452DRAFT_271087 [Aplosporella prunicola CBS 121167]KAF2142240.1 hypothetical protein K452DRAFT_271087 [Aplosporella prunicola CBS 121167]
MDAETRAHFAKDLQDVHLIYDYNIKHTADDQDREPEKWRYEMWIQCEDRIVYAIHGGPMAGRRNFQTCSYQCIRPGELWQCNWLEETGTVCSWVYDIPQSRITTLIAFSKAGHWTNPIAAHGDKRNEADFARWRDLAKIGTQTDRVMLAEQADIIERFYGKGELEPIRREWATL